MGTLGSHSMRLRCKVTVIKVFCEALVQKGAEHVHDVYVAGSLSLPRQSNHDTLRTVLRTASTKIAHRFSEMLRNF